MEKIKTLFLLTFFIPLLGRGQTQNEFIVDIQNPEYFDLVYQSVPVVFQNYFSASVAGVYESEQLVTIIPAPGTSIRLVGGLLPSLPPPGQQGGGGGTTIRSRPPIGPRMASALTPDSVSNVTVFPNPVEKELNFQLNNEKVVEFSIFNLSGKRVINEKTEPVDNKIVNVSMLEKGFYILQLITEKNQPLSIQFIKE